MKLPNKAKATIKKQLSSSGNLPKKSTSAVVQTHQTTNMSEKPEKKVIYSFNEGDLVTTNPQDKEFKDSSSICLVLDYKDGEFLTVWRPTGQFSVRASKVRIIQRA